MIAEIQPDALVQREPLIATANTGDARAQFLLAERYRIGDELTPRDYAQAFKWYGLAAEQGDADAQNDLAQMHYSGTGAPRNAKKAVTWYRQAADQGLAVAQFNLANCYLQGTGVEQDDKEAVAWLRKAMVQDYVFAVTQLGTLFQLGRGVAKDLVTAAQLHVLAAKAGDPLAISNLSSYRQQLEQIALGGNASASVSLAAIFDRGLGVAQDAATALAWTRWARAHYTPDVDEHVPLELERLEFEHVIMGTSDVERLAEALLAEMRRSREAVRRT